MNRTVTMFIADAIRAAARKRGWTLNDLARHSEKFTERTLRLLMGHRRHLTVDEFYDLACAVEVPATDLVVQAEDTAAEVQARDLLEHLDVQHLREVMQ